MLYLGLMQSLLPCQMNPLRSYATNYIRLELMP